MTPIEFIYFDVGGVAIKDFSATQKWEEMKTEVLGMTPVQSEAAERIVDRYLSEVHRGRDVDALLSIISGELGIKLPEGFSFLTYSVENFECNDSIWPLLSKLRTRYRLGLLTNMWPGLLTAIEGCGLLPPVTWDVIIDSSVEGVEKPNPEIYYLAQDRAGVDPQKILFIDNGKVNLEPAEKCGWHTFHYDSHDYDRSARQLAAFFSL